MLHALLLAATLNLTQATPPPDPPETVMTTFRPLPGKAGDLQRVLWESWDVMTRLHLNAAGREHHIWRGQAEDGRVLLFQMFTWRDHATPDDAPKELLAVWKKMSALVEKGNGIEFVEVYEVDPPR